MSDLLATELVTLLQATGGSYDASGSYVPTAPVSVAIRATVQPLSGDKAQTAFPGERSSRWKKLYTQSTQPRTVAQTPGNTPADRLLIDGDTYEVRTAKHHRPPSPIPHTYVEAVQVQEGGS